MRIRLRRGDAGGQGLVEFTLLLPLFLVLLLGMLEFGIAFTHNQALEYATREGARTGSALANGGGALGCGAGQSPNWKYVDSQNPGVDPQIIAAVERVLTSDGSPVKDHLDLVPAITIYKASDAGTELGPADVWIYNSGAGPNVGGKKLDYTLQSETWAPCDRDFTPPADALGVSLSYSYELQTGLGSLLKFFGGSGWTTIPMSDRTVMNINPTNLNYAP